MRKLPIPFSDPMVRAILEGRKTQTRRILDPQPIYEPGGVIRGGPDWHMNYGKPRWIVEPRHRYAVGDLLWVRESVIKTPAGIAYVADGAGHYGAGGKLRATPSIRTPRSASRITLRVTGVKVERLQEISEADAIAEGIEPSQRLAGAWKAYSDSPKPLTGAAWYVLARGLGNVCLDRPHSFATLWESVNGPGSWNDNPWVVAISFEPIFKNIDQVERADG